MPLWIRVPAMLRSVFVGVWTLPPWQMEGWLHLIIEFWMCQDRHLLYFQVFISALLLWDSSITALPAASSGLTRRAFTELPSVYYWKPWGVDAVWIPHSMLAAGVYVWREGFWSCIVRFWHLLGHTLKTLLHVPLGMYWLHPAVLWRCSPLFPVKPSMPIAYCDLFLSIFSVSTMLEYLRLGTYKEVRFSLPHDSI